MAGSKNLKSEDELDSDCSFDFQMNTEGDPVFPCDLDSDSHIPKASTLEYSLWSQYDDSVIGDVLSATSNDDDHKTTVKSSSVSNIRDTVDENADDKSDDANSSFEANGNVSSKNKNNTGSVFVGPRFSSGDALQLLKNPGNSKIHTSRLQEEIQMNSIYLFDTSASDDLYWTNDGKSWAYGRLRDEPYTKQNKSLHALVTQRQYTLLHNGKRVNFFRNEIWQLYGDSKTPSKWNPPLVIVYYHGTFPIKDAQNTNHGNFGKPKRVPKIFKKSSSSYSWKKETSVFVRLQHEDKDDCDARVKSPLSHPVDQYSIADVAEPLGGEESEFADAEDVQEISSPKLSDHERGFVKTPKATLKKIDELLAQGIKPAAVNRALNILEIQDGFFESARNKKQIENRRQRTKESFSGSHDDLKDVYALAIDHREVIRRFELIPGLLVVSRHPEMEAHFEDLYRVVPRMFLYYDTTFNLGDRFVSILSIRHPGLMKNPVFPLSILYHEYTDKKFTHSPFFKTVVTDFKQLNSKKTVICTDRELSIKSAVFECLPDATHIFCYLHILKNVDRWTASKQYNRKERTKLHYDVKLLLWSDSMIIYNSLLAEFCPDDEVTIDDVLDGVDEAGNVLEIDPTADSIEIENGDPSHIDKTTRMPWDKRFQAYYKRFLDADIRRSCKAVVAKLGIFNKYSGITTNPSESMNSYIQSQVEKRPTLYQLINGVYRIQMSQLWEIKKGLWESKGNNRMDPEFLKKRDKLAPISINTSILEWTTEFRDSTNTKVTLRMDQEVNYTTKLSEAKMLVDAGLVVFVKNGNWMVTDKRDRNWLVNFPNQKCSCISKSRCIHVVAVNWANDVVGNPNFDQLNYVTPPSLTDLHKNQLSSKVGKKQGSDHRVPPEYEKPEAIEETRNEFELDNATEGTGSDTKLKNLQGELENNFKMVQLPSTTSKNASMKCLLIGPTWLTLRDLKSLQESVPTSEIKLLGTWVFENEKTMREPFIPHWLTDFVIDAYLHKITDGIRYKYLAVAEVTSLLLGQSARRLKKSCDWTKLEALILPMNSGSHWCMVIVSLVNKTIQCYNSMDPLWTLDDSELNNVHNFINSSTDQSAWKVTSPKSYQQNDYESCGLIVLANAQAYVQGREPLQAVNVPLFRHHVLKLLVGECNVLRQHKRDKFCAVCEKQLPVGLNRSKRTDFIKCEQCNCWRHVSCLNDDPSNIKNGLAPFVCS